VDDFVHARDGPDSDSFTAILDWRGRITIPAETRRRLRLKFRDMVSVSVNGGDASDR